MRVFFESPIEAINEEEEETKSSMKICNFLSKLRRLCQDGGFLKWRLYLDGNRKFDFSRMKADLTGLKI